MVKKYELFRLDNRPLPKQQSGVVLIVSLVFLVALTAVAAALMQNTTTDMKMSGATQEKALATQEAISEMDRIIYNEVNRVNANGAGNKINRFTLPAESFTNPVSLTVTKPDITEGELNVINPLLLETDCPPALSASSVEVFTCNVLRVRLERDYGRNYNSNVEVNSGVAQQLFKKGS